MFCIDVKNIDLDLFNCKVIKSIKNVNTVMEINVTKYLYTIYVNIYLCKTVP